MVAWTADATFDALAATVQLALGLAILIRRPRVEWAIVLAAIFVGNGALAVNSILSGQWGAWTPETATRVFYDLDRTVTLLVLYLALAYPQRPKWAKQRWVLPVAFAILWASVVVTRNVLDMPFFFGIPAAEQPVGCHPVHCFRATLLSYWSYHITNIGFIVLLVRWAYLLPRLTSPIEITHLRLLFAAFAIRAVHVELIVYRAGPLALLWESDPYLQIDPWLPISYVRGGIALAAIAVATALLLHGRRRLPSDRRRAVDFVLVFFFLGALEASFTGARPLFGYAGIAPQYYFDSALHLDVLVLRPILIAYAMVRYDFLGSWASSRGTLLAVATALATFGYAAGLRNNLSDFSTSAAISWTLVIAISIVLGAITMVLLRTYIGPVRNDAVQRYLALLEDAYRNGTPSAAGVAQLEVQRRRLGVDADEAEALRAAVAGRWKDDGLWLPGQRIAGRYELRKLLGSGGWGEVYRAEDIIDGQDVVLKRTKHLTPVERKALLAESYALTKLSHPNLVPLLRTNIVDGEPVLVLQLMAGGSLASRLAEGPLAEPQAHRVATGLLRALTAVHDAGFVHADVKPGNVLFDEHGEARLGDFGLARQTGTRSRLGDPTPTANGGGSARYLAPEQARGGPATGASDVYAAGVVLLECLTGRHPISNAVPEYEQRRLVAEHEFALPNLGAWQPLLEQMLARNPRRRPTSRQALALVPN